MSQNPKARRLTPCHRHPNLPTTTGLCAPCLHERLSLLNPSTSSSAAAPPPELRRCKTFSAEKNFSSAFEPRRKSLSSLFDLDNDDDGDSTKVESRNLGLTCHVTEIREEVEEEEDDNDNDDEVEIEIARVCDFRNDNNEGEFDFDLENGKSIKEFIDLELQGNSKSDNATTSSNNRKDFKHIAGSLASVFSNKLRKWRKNHQNSHGNRRHDRDCNVRGRRLSYTQSEVADYGFGRRSCDNDPRGSIDLGRASIDCGAFGRKSCDSDPRFSIDFGRASLDCRRMSIDENKSEFVELPRASWDGYVGGGRGDRPVVSVIENAMATVYGFDNRVLGEGKVKMENGEGNDFMVRRRNGFDRCSSVRRDTVLMPEDGAANGLSCARVSPASIGVANGTKMVITEKELSEWRLSSRKDDSSGSFETASKDLGSVSSSSIGMDEKKCRQWSKLWRFWGLLHRKKGDKSSNSDDELARVDGASTSGSHDSSSAVRPSRTDFKSIVKRRQDNGVLARNRSVKYSPNNIENGLLRFYLTPLRSSRRNKLGKSRLEKSHSLARSVLL